jgi:hypothetical protein
MSLSKHCRRVVVRPKDVIYTFLILMGLTVVLLTVWSVVDPLRWTLIELNTGLDSFGRATEVVGQCSSESETNELIFYAFFFLINFVVVTVANYQAYLSRNVMTDFNESLHMCISMAALGEAAVLGVPVLVLVRISGSPSSIFVVQSVLVSVLCLCLLLPVFIPKFALRNSKRKAPNRTLPSEAASTELSQSYQGNSILNFVALPTVES